MKPLVPRQYLGPFILLTFCFAAWGVANNMTDPLVKVFSKVFVMSNMEGALVQFAFYGAYFCLAIPAALLIRRTTYKTGVLTGLGLFILGALLFFPASQTMVYWHFLLALYILAGGLSILETSANPFVLKLGDPETATRRLNLAQAFNPVGSNLGVLLANAFILSQISPLSETERAALRESDPQRLEELLRADLAVVMGPYVGVAVFLIVLWVTIAVTRMPHASDAEDRTSVLGAFSRLLRNRIYALGVVAQFFYVAAQICVWTFILHYADRHVGYNDEDAGAFLQASLIVFLVFRFVFTALMGRYTPALLLTLAGLAGCTLCLFAVIFPGMAGLYALVGVSACMSLMFPTIYGLALANVGGDAKLGGAGLVMAILGGALLPLLQGRLIDAFSPAVSYTVPAGCLLIVAVYGLMCRNSRSAVGFLKAD